MSYVIAAVVLAAATLVLCFIAFWVGRGKMILEYKAYLLAREKELDELELKYKQ